MIPLFADAAPTVGQTILQAFLQYALPPLLAVLVPALVALVVKLATYLHAKESESKAARIGAVVADAASSVVAELNATLRPKLEAALADGVLTDKEKAELKAAALDALKSKLPAPLMAGATAIFGSFVDTWMGGLIERAVSAQKPIYPPEQLFDASGKPVTGTETVPLSPAP